MRRLFHRGRLRASLLPALLGAAGLVAAPLHASEDAAPAIVEEMDAPPITVLVLLDGFRPDYLDRGITPHLSALAGEGVRGSLEPVFPSVTFPNHFTVMTGLYPDHHGILGNEFEQAGSGLRFSTADRALFDQRMWWDKAVPLWASANEQGVPAAATFWMMNGLDREGRGPPRLHQLEKDLPPAEEARKFLQWFDDPAAEPPRLLFLYFHQVDGAGHEYGPASRESDPAIAEADAAVGLVIAGLAQRGLWERTNLVVLADHGMAETGGGRIMQLEALAGPVAFRTVGEGAYAAVYPEDPADLDALAARLARRHDHGQCWRREELPAALHFGSNRDIAPIFCVADPGWLFRRNDRGSYGHETGGSHGYDPAAPDMAALFLAHGPAFRQGFRMPQFSSVHVYSLLAQLSGVAPEPNDGDPQAIAPMLRPRP